MIESRGAASGGQGSQPAHTTLPVPPLRIAAIDRDEEFMRLLATQTRPLGWTLLVHRGPVTATTLLNGRPHAVLVDIGLLGPRWDDWLARHPGRVPNLGVIVCTGRSTVSQRVRGLHLGADDWITKPCYVEEVIARLHAIVRARSLPLATTQTPLRRGVLELRPDLHETFVARRPVGLTRREFEVLLHLAHHAGRVVERERLYSEVWGYQMAQGSRSIDTLVRKIRNKLASVSPGWRYIHTHKGVGYRFAVRRSSGMKSRGRGRS
jgi:DNA-binding response OmpR family regulator